MEKGYLKFQYDGGNGFLHFLKVDDVYTSLTKINSKKMDVIKNTNLLEIAIGMKATDYTKYSVNIVTKEETVRALYDEMLELNHTHFKQWDNDLCKLEFKISE